MDNKFDYKKDVTFYLGEHDIKNDTELNVYQKSSLAAMLTGGTYNRQSIMNDNIVKSAELYTQSKSSTVTGLYDAKTKKGDGRSIDVFTKDGNKVASCEIMIHVSDDALDKIMPNGDYARNLKDYTWDDFEKLEAIINEQKAAAEKEAASNESDDFAAAIAEITEPDEIRL